MSCCRTYKRPLTITRTERQPRRKGSPAAVLGALQPCPIANPAWRCGHSSIHVWGAVGVPSFGLYNNKSVHTSYTTPVSLAQVGFFCLFLSGKKIKKERKEAKAFCSEKGVQELFSGCSAMRMGRR